MFQTIIKFAPVLSVVSYLIFTLLLTPSQYTKNIDMYLFNKLHTCSLNDEFMPSDHTSILFNHFYDDILYNRFITDTIMYYMYIDKIMLFLFIVFILSNLITAVLALELIIKLINRLV
jgi:hypothetical protein